ncbi:Potassium transporter family protein [Klebsormidium nitens]|uniref:Potassium transporter family protein n=1 Tax=Klebsormidium nitens TaxID=105231 RepID=A0A0U9HMQ2_KLENI|nr:Potassium transporter family protein [Klebsormidium nitens]|eukprot:GAQ85462.1 Potassium transporter family protein [Klebsormidium nitens]
MDDPDHSTGFAQQVLCAISHYLAYGSTKELLHRTPSSGPGSPMSHVSSSSALSHVGSSTALVPGPTDTPRSPSALDTPKKRPIRLSLTERGWQMSLVKEAAQHEIMYIKTKPILKPAKSATHMQRFLLWCYNVLLDVSLSPTDALNMPRAQLLMLLMVYEIK